MIEVEAFEKFVNPPEYQEIITITPTWLRKIHEVLIETNTPYPITQTKSESSLACQQNDGKLETSNFARNFPQPEIQKARNLDTCIRNTIAMVSNKAASSVEKAHATVQIKCKF